MICELCKEAEATTSPCDTCDRKDKCSSPVRGMRTCESCAEGYSEIRDFILFIKSLAEGVNVTATLMAEREHSVN